MITRAWHTFSISASVARNKQPWISNQTVKMKNVSGVGKGTAILYVGHRHTKPICATAQLSAVYPKGVYHVAIRRVH